MNNFKEIAKEYGINSGAAYEHLFSNHTHPLGDEGKDMVTFDTAIDAIKLSEIEMHDEYLQQLKKVKDDASWFMQIINKLFCMHDWEKMEVRTISSGTGDRKRIINEIIIYNCKKCGKIKQQKIGVDD